jgi:hypothetical protein
METNYFKKINDLTYLRNERIKNSLNKNKYNKDILNLKINNRKKNVDKFIMLNRETKLKKLSLFEISNFIYSNNSNIFQIINSLNNLNEILNTNLEKSNKEYIITNIIYRIIDILFHSNNKNIIISCINSLINLTKNDDFFIAPLVSLDIITNLKKFIDKNKNCNDYMNAILILLSNMISCKKYYFIINKNINIYNLIKNKLNSFIMTSNFYCIKEEFDDLITLLYNFILPFPETELILLKDLALNSIILYRQIYKVYKKEKNDKKQLLNLILTLNDILTSFSRNEEIIDLFISQNFFEDINNIIKENLNKKLNLNIINLLSHLLNGNDEQKVKILEKKNYPPFLENLININDKHLFLKYFQCIISLTHNSEKFTKIYFENDNFILFLYNIFKESNYNKIRIKILIFLIYSLRDNYLPIFIEKIKEINFIPLIIYFLEENKMFKTKHINNHYCLIENCLEIIYLVNERDEKIKLNLEYYGLKDLLEKLIDKKNIGNYAFVLYNKLYEKENILKFENENIMDISEEFN